MDQLSIINSCFITKRKYLTNLSTTATDAGCHFSQVHLLSELVDYRFALMAGNFKVITKE